MSQSIAINIAKVQQRIGAAAKKSSRSSDSVTLIAVSKTHSSNAVREACTAGVRHIGESYLQEALEKQDALRDLNLTWHFIGPIQSNKTRPIAERFDWVHSVDRLKIARRLSEQRPVSSAPLNICLQVNISGEASKSGLRLDELPATAAAVARLTGVTLRGLMAIPQRSDHPELQHQAFRQLANAAKALRDVHPQLDTLSMGMSGDLEAAIAEGATMVRIGTDIFGPRPS